ncbi:hypothetical protein Ob7_04372 [Thermosipho africanus Ob7]|jgi:hypothetical protein|uniref:DUF4416 domain-containing protein n=1 Tax=Thermosipho africanus (strain TCF52B) TaxID=484019 RepID=B7ID24_THEAB|nr:MULTISPECIES: DUF4416 family protein [Thermosipho]ACJ75901.1 conserved hypothetical protein [Thermosipho africanus TCF52B]MBZ4650249.1 hypothetical protein [Thermosipho sp. (in: thermotogales)]MDK2838909.1 hypothetical protein [Thermosipho sp. (in: thermotogales)]MDK2900891.1 hypothetical protein [Thermosipho sp. (in: thermotogales)]RDI91792.1 hypothetical protein Ob7_04372 [Thermosipho africanus Ob7]
MGKVRRVDLVNLVMFFFSSQVEYWLSEVENELIEKFGPIDYKSDILDFEKYTLYYNKEMGEGVKGILLSFERLIHPYQLADIKNMTNEIEQRYAVKGNRRFNIDPGYIHHMQFVLATTKMWPHRIYIGKGIYAETTLMYINGRWKDYDFTYPNYKEEEYKRELEKIRLKYLEKRKKFLR